MSRHPQGPAGPLAAPAFVPHGIWTGLTLVLVLLSAPRAGAGDLFASHGGQCRPAHTVAGRCPFPGPVAGLPAQAASVPAPQGGVRLVLSARGGSAPKVLGENPGAGHRHPFTLVGNRSGLESAVRIEVRDGETWLAAGPTFPGRETGLAAFQAEASSVASR
jgi:hypothetical protein